MTKYRAIPTVIDGIRFASKKEARRFQELKLLERAGKITELELQPRFDLFIPNSDKGKVGTYVGDFRYLDIERNITVLEDVKGMKTPVYRLKKKLMKAIYGIDIQEI